MADSTSLINEFTKSALVFEGYIAIRAGTVGDFTYKKYDQLMELTIDTVPEVVAHFNSTKQKHNVIVGNNSTAIISLKETVDLYLKSSDPEDKNLLNFIITELNNELRVVPTVFTGIQKTESASNPDFIVEVLEGDILAVRKRRNLDTGDYTIEFEFSINKRTPEAADSDPVPVPS